MHCQFARRTLFPAKRAVARIGPGPVVLAFAAAWLILAGPAFAADRATNAPATLVIPRSVFVDDPAGKDPFFPNSGRRHATDSLSSQTTNVVTGVDALVYRGLIGPPEKRIALINNRTFTKGEEGEVRVPGGGKVTVRVVDIQEKSVKVIIGGLSGEREVKLQERPRLKAD